MKTISLFLISITLGAVAVAQDQAAYPSKVSEVLSTYTPSADAHSPAAMAKAADAFLGALGDDLKKQALDDAASTGAKLTEVQELNRQANEVSKSIGKAEDADERDRDPEPTEAHENDT